MAVAIGDRHHRVREGGIVVVAEAEVGQRVADAAIKTGRDQHQLRAEGFGRG